MLLLAVLHPRRALAGLVDESLDLGLEPLVEAHDERELEAALATRARVIGINNRDLRTLDVDPERAVALRHLVPEDRLVIAESGVRDPATVRGWRAAGFDAALVGETLVRAGDPESAARAMVEAGAPPSDPVEAARTPFVKICGITDEAGVRAALAAGADAIGLNLVPGTPRALSLEEAANPATVARSIAPVDRRPAVVAITVDRSAADLNEIAAALDADAIQLSGAEDPALVAAPRSPGVEDPAPPARSRRRRRSCRDGHISDATGDQCRSRECCGGSHRAGTCDSSRRAPRGSCWTRPAGRIPAAQVDAPILPSSRRSPARCR